LISNTENITGIASITSKVQLWHRNNYHWFLKYEVQYPDIIVQATHFDQEKPHRLTVTLLPLPSQDKTVTSVSVAWRIYDFCWDVYTEHNDDLATTVNVDGVMLNLTPFGKAIVPPPMSACSLEMGQEGTIVGVAFSPKSKRDCVVSDEPRLDMIVHLSNGVLKFVGLGYGARSGILTTCNIGNYQPPASIGSTTLSDVENLDSTSIRQLLIVEVKDGIVRLLGVQCSLGPAEAENLLVFDVNLAHVEATPENNNREAKFTLQLVNTIQLDGKVLRIVNFLKGGGEALIELNDGYLLQYTSEDGCVVPLDAEPLLEPCPWIQAFTAEKQDIPSPAAEMAHMSNDETDIGFHRKHIVVGLSSRKRLYCGEQLLCSSASTFALSYFHGFVVYVSLGSRAQLHFIPLYNLVLWDPLSGSDDFILEGYEPRQVERGSRVLAVRSNSPSVVLELPRGNLELVVPRALTLPFCMRLIDQRRYGKAFDIMRRNKVDLNLLVDLNPKAFLEDVTLFLDQVDKESHLNLFLSCLFDGDITMYKYQVPEWIRFQRTNPLQAKSNFDFSQKVNGVCQAMRTAMVEREGASNNEKSSFLLPILSTFAKESPPKLESALELIRDNAIARHAKSSKASRLKVLLSDTCQQAVQYLAFLADYNLLFNTALGMYDWDLAKAVARNSQMDPKVYLPLIKRLNGMEDQEMARYEVNMKLARHELALQCLARCGSEGGEQTTNFEKCLGLIEEFGLHKLGLEIFADQKLERRKILVSLGERCFSEKKFKTALSIYLSAEPRDLSGAMKAARACHDWKAVFACMHEEGGHNCTDPETMKELLQKLATEMSDELNEYAPSLTGEERKGCYLDSARLLLDYCYDVDGAVDVLIGGKEWTEGHRMAGLHNRTDLIGSCIEAAASFGETCAEDFEERADAFESTNSRYAEVLLIRQDAHRQAGEEGEVINDTGSVYSVSSQMSSNSLQSNMSGSSIGSVSSYSSVISAGATSTFSLTTKTNKHKSKFNQIGAGQKKKKKKKSERKGRNRVKPGSKEELDALVGTLRQNCVYEDEFNSILETVTFLSRVDHVEVARTLFDRYNELRRRIDKNQQERLRKAENNTAPPNHTSSTYEHAELVNVVLPCEKEVNALHCEPLPSYLEEVFMYSQL
jgi:elongator complex protein 1